MSPRHHVRTSSGFYHIGPIGRDTPRAIMLPVCAMCAIMVDGPVLISCGNAEGHGGYRAREDGIGQSITASPNSDVVTGTQAKGQAERADATQPSSVEATWRKRPILTTRSWRSNCRQPGGTGSTSSPRLHPTRQLLMSYWVEQHCRDLCPPHWREAGRH